jgi:phosphonatase-like hydrolase
MATRLVVFELIGTTVRDSGHATQHAIRDTLAARGVDVRDGALDGVRGMAPVQAIRTLLEGHGRDDLLDQAGAIGADLSSRLQRHYRMPGTAVPTPGCDAVFATLRRAGIRVAIGTAMPRAVADQVCAQVGWTETSGIVDAIITGEQVSRPRPYPDMIDALRLRFGDIAPADVIKVGDTPLDLQEGTMAGCGLVVGVADDPRLRGHLMQHPHDAILGSVAELPGLLRNRKLMPA